MLSSHLAANPNVTRSQRPLGSNPTDVEWLFNRISLFCLLFLYLIFHNSGTCNFLISFIFLQRTVLPVLTTLKNYFCLQNNYKHFQTSNDCWDLKFHPGQMGSVHVGPLQRVCLKNWQKRAVSLLVIPVFQNRFANSWTFWNSKVETAAPVWYWISI